MNTFRMGLVMMATIVGGNMYAINRIKFDQAGLKIGEKVWDVKFTIATTK